jgi:flagellar basal-body rod protein FlgC
MDYRVAFEIASAGMGLEKRRVEVAALNLANMHASTAPGQVGYVPQKVVASPLGVHFAQSLGHAAEAMQSGGLARDIAVVPSPVAPRLVNDPGHPHANAQGMVSYPGVDHASEMVSVMTALRAYEANVVVASMAKSMAAKALEIGGA